MQEPPTEKPAGSHVLRSVLVGTAQVLAVFAAIVVTIIVLGSPAGPSMRDRAYEAAVRSDLRDLEMAQDAYFADSGSYGASLAELDFNASENVSIRLTLVGDSAWSASGTHTNIPVRCTIFVGDIEPPIASAEERYPTCEEAQ